MKHPKYSRQILDPNENVGKRGENLLSILEPQACILFDVLVEQTVEKSLREEKSHTVDGSDIPNNHLGYIKPMEIMGSTDKLPTVSTTTDFNWFFWPDFWLPSTVMATWQGIQSLNSAPDVWRAVSVAEKSLLRL